MTPTPRDRSVLFPELICVVCVRNADPRPRQPRAADVSWFSPGEADLNDAEVLFISLMLCLRGFASERELKEWSAKVLLDEPNALDLKEKWKPATTGEAFSTRGRRISVALYS